MQSSGSEGASLREQAIPTISTQVLKLEAASVPTSAQGFKLQARVHKLQNPQARVQAHKPTSRGASDKNKCIFRMLHVEANLVG